MLNGISSLKIILNEINRESCPKIINLHCHTTFSDGSLTPKQLMAQATQLGLKHIAITDHHNIDAYLQLTFNDTYNQLDISKYPKLWPGIEISCLIKNCLVHVIGLDFDINNIDLKPYTKGESVNGSALSGKVVIDAIHAAGGVAILAHPARYRIHFRDLIYESANLGIDGAEVWYDYDFNPIWQYSPLICDEIEAEINNLGLLKSCGTDTHGLSLLGR